DFKINKIRGDCVTLRYMDELAVSGVFEDHSRLYYSCRRSNSTGSMRTGAIDSASQFTQPPDARWSSILPNPRSPVTPVERLSFSQFFFSVIQADLSFAAITSAAADRYSHK